MVGGRIGSQVAGGLGAGIVVGAVLIAATFAVSDRMALPAVLAAFGAVALLVRPELGLYLSAMMTPIERLGRLTDDSATVTLSLMRIVGVGVFGVYALHYLIRRQRPYLPIEVWLLAAWVALVLASTAWTSDPTASKRGFGLYAGNLLFFVLIINAVRSRAMARRLIALSIVVSAGLGVASLYQWRFGDTLTIDETVGAGSFDMSDRLAGVWVDATEIKTLGARRRLAGPTSHPTVYAANLLNLLPLCVWFFHRRLKPWLVLGLLGAIGVFIVSLMLTGTRAAVLTAGILGLLLVPTRLVVLRPWTIGLAVTAVLALPFVLPESVVQRVFDTRQYTFEKSASLSLRMAYWRAGFEVIQDNPLLGAGYSNFHEIPKRVPELSPEATTIHNFVIQIWAELGVVGFSTFALFLFLIARNIFRAHRGFRDRGDENHALLCNALLLSFVAPMILGMSCDWHHFPVKIWWLVVGLSVALRRVAMGEIEEEAPEPILPSLPRTAHRVAAT